MNRFWWCCASCNGNADLLREKWVCILNHIPDEHEWDGTTWYHRYAHGPSSVHQRKKWTLKESPAYKVLKSIVLDKRTIDDLSYLTQFKHSGELEVFHALLNVKTAFSYDGMPTPSWPLWSTMAVLGEIKLSQEKVHQ